MPQPGSTQRFDDVVIGTGAAGQSVAFDAAAAGRKVVMIDRTTPGGTCALQGCSPKKVMVNAAKLVRQSRFAEGQLLEGHTTMVRWDRLHDVWKGFTDAVPVEFREKCDKAGVTLVEGEARFVASHAVEVAGRRIEADRFMIASGSRPAPAPFEGGELCIDSNQFFFVRELPRRMLVVGGGYIGMEFGFAMAMAGCEVTVVDAAEILDGFDGDHVAMWLDNCRDVPMRFFDHCKVERLSRGREDGPLRAKLDSGEELVVDLALIAAGRVPNVDALELEACGVEYCGKKGIKIDNFGRTTAAHVWAAGDCVDAPWPPLKTTAELLGETVARCWRGEECDAYDPRGTASTTFLYPPIAGVGPTEEQLRESGARFRKRADDLTEKGEIRKWGPGTPAAYKVFLDESGERILAAHLIGPAADDQINLFALAIRHGITRRQLLDTALAYPTWTDQIKAMLG